MHVGAYFPLWTFRDGASLLERAVGEIGIDHVVVPVVTGPLSVFRNPTHCDPPAFATEGGWHFPPESKRYSACGIRPHAARWMAQRDWLSQLAEAAEKFAIGVACRAEPAAASAAVDRHDPLLLRDPWGEPFASRAGCLCNPALRELTSAIIADLSRAPFERVELQCAAPPCTTLQRLMGCGLADACFCAACRQLTEREGVEVNVAMQAARETVTHGFHATRQHNPALHDALSAMLRIRDTDVTRWIETLQRNGASGAPQSGNSGPRVANIGAMRRSGLMVELESQSSADDPAGELVRQATSAVEHGAKLLIFTGLDGSPREAITWAKQAARFARRAANA